MIFLNESLSNVLQFFTLPAEIIGISLAFMELRYPNVTARANRNYLNLDLWHRRNTILSLNTLKEYWSKGIPKGAETVERSSLVASRVALIVAIFGLALLVMLFLSSLIDVLIVDLPVNGSNVLILTAIVLVSSLVIRLFVRLIPDRPIGGIGLLLASIGVLGELYQVLVYLKYEGDILGVIGGIAAIVFVILFFLSFYIWTKSDNVKV